MTESKDKNKVATISELVTFKSLDELRAYGDEMAKTGFTPLKSGKDIVAAILTGQELGLKPMFSANNIYPINGKATLGVHAINKLLLENGIITEKIRDFEPCVNFVMKGEDGLAALIDSNGKDVKRVADADGNFTKAPEGSSPIVLREGFVDEAPADHEVKGKKIVNYKTVIKMTRKMRQPDGTFKDLVVIGSFSTKEAASVIINKVGETLLSKDNWRNYPKTMTYTRAFTFTAKEIADDILGGLPETSEYADFKNIAYTMTEEGKATVIKTENKESFNTEDINEATVVDEVKDDTSTETDQTDESSNKEN